MIEYLNRETVMKELDRNSITKKITLSDGVSIYDSIQKLPTADVVEVETIKSWLYSIAINNVNNNGDFSDACEEIISRLDGLRRFTNERSSNDL